MDESETVRAKLLKSLYPEETRGIALEAAFRAWGDYLEMQGSDWRESWNSWEVRRAMWICRERDR